MEKITRRKALGLAGLATTLGMCHGCGLPEMPANAEEHQTEDAPFPKHAAGLVAIRAAVAASGRRSGLSLVSRRKLHVRRLQKRAVVDPTKGPPRRRPLSFRHVQVRPRRLRRLGDALRRAQRRRGPARGLFFQEKQHRATG